MAVIETVSAGNPIIRENSIAVTDVKSGLVKQVIRDLIDSMRHEDLIGMAAPQIGHNLRIYVSELRETKYRKDNTDKVRVFINPKIIEKSKELSTGYEGCGSVAHAGLFGPVKRSSEVKVKAQDEKGESFEFTAKGLLAVVMQHEIDHLDGILFIDKIEDTKKVMSQDEYIKFCNKQK